ncbi:AIPR family protein [Hymenobacter sp. BT770]|uniref:AIPR family protein n=1 Tax=Hymenobacter sp. BT770 TaxID=2886942 RepID=UPI001D11C775|nr:AIPR family protein [Hymenobacter sp. BT770]MCC3154601.1 AIPR family protein [Hymenobacter sp. BT770]MDO3416655.1 AIPR family protein [Hymenobacter sp. BT770]
MNKIAERFTIPIDEAFEILSIAAILDRPFDEVHSDIIVKGKQDGGIDGIYFEGDNGDYTIHAFQCKNSKSLKQNDIDKFRNDFKDIFIDGNKINKQNIDSLLPKIKEYEKLVNSGMVMQIKLHFLYNGDRSDKKYTQNTDLYNAYHVQGEFEILDSNDIYAKISSLVKSQNRRKSVGFTFKPENSNITSSKDNQGLISFSIYEVKAAIFRLHAFQLCELLEEELRINGTIEKAFSDNIRWFLGRTNLTNEKIIETIQSDNNFYFPFLNNGITIICEEFKLPHNPQLGKYAIPTKNPVIVNGLQTTYLLYQEFLKDKSKLTDVYLTVKLYQTDNPELVDMITDATNTQSAISFKDKLSNKKFNSYIKTVFENKNIGYITKRGEVFTNSFSTSLQKSVQNELPLTLWYSSFYEEPYIAYASAKIVFKEIYQASINSRHPLHNLFNGNTDSPLYAQVFLAYTIYDIYLNKFRKNNDKTIDDIHFEKVENLDSLPKEFLVYMVYKVLEDDLDSISNDKIFDAIDFVGSIIKPGPNMYYTDKHSFISAVLDTSGFVMEGDLEFFMAKIMNIRDEKEAALNIASLHPSIDNIKI